MSRRPFLAIVIAATLVGGFGLWHFSRERIATGASNDATVLWGSDMAVQGEALSPDARTAVLGAGVPVQGRIGTISGGVLSLGNLRSGSEILLPLPDGRILRGQVNLVLTETDGIVRVGGSLIGTPTGTFSLHQSETGLSGRILLPEEQIGYVLVSTPTDPDSTAAYELGIAEIYCYAMPRAPEPDAILAPQAALPDFQPQAAPPIFSSRPTATDVVYLDFDGATVTDPDWNGGNTVVAAPSPLNDSQIEEVWKRVKEDYLPFNVDITTDPGRYDSAPVGRRVRVIITPTDTVAPGSGGVAYLETYARAGTLGFSTTIPAWVFNSTPASIADAISHEVGHTLGLRHDGDLSLPSGNPGRQYYFGHGSGATSWGPIMGAPYGRALSQWSKGEYPNASNTENDLSIITGGESMPFGRSLGIPVTNPIRYVADDFSNVRGLATPLVVTNGTYSQAGIISSAGDTDYFVLSINAPTTFSLTHTELASPAPNLDLEVAIENGNGDLLELINPPDELTASFVLSYPAGSYFIRVRGAGKPPVSGSGYSNYGSIGQYSLQGSVSNLPVITKQPENQSVALGSTANLRVIAISNVDLTYEWRHDGVPVSNDGRHSGAQTDSLTITGVENGDAGTYTVVVTNSTGPLTSNPAILTVTVPSEITARPRTTVALEGESLDFQIGATGEGTLHYQWLKDGAPIDGATSSNFSIPNAVRGDSGIYGVSVTDDAGTTLTYFHVRVVPAGLTPVVWGAYQSGQRDVPAGLTDIVEVSAGNQFTLALRADGTVVAWGSFFGLPEGGVPAGLTNVVAISAGNTSAMALKDDGTVVAWGSDIYGKSTVPPGIDDAIAIRAGMDNYNMIVRADGSVVMLGYGPPVGPANLPDVVDVRDAGPHQAIALKSDGSLIVWEETGTQLANLNPPADVVPVSQFDTYGAQVIGVNRQGRAQTWGQQLPTINPAPNLSSGFVKVGTGFEYAAALRADGTVTAWGGSMAWAQPLSELADIVGVVDMDAGQSHIAMLIPTGTDELPPWISRQPLSQLAVTGTTSRLKVLAFGSGVLTYQWRHDNVDLVDDARISGANTGTLTINDTTADDAGTYDVLITNAFGNVLSLPSTLTVIPAPPTSPIISHPGNRLARVGDNLSLTVESDPNEFATYQWYHDGSLLPGKTGPTLELTNISTANRGIYAVVVSGVSGDFVSLSRVAVAEDNVALWPVGEHPFIQTVVATGLSSIMQVASDYGRMMAISGDGEVHVWGSNNWGESSVPPGLRNPIALSLGLYNTAALTADGHVAVWGSNSFVGPLDVPEEVVGAVDVVLGDYAATALLADGTVRTWGWFPYEWVPPPADLSGVVKIVAGGTFFVALKYDGTVAAWGSNFNGESTVPPGLTDVVDIQAGYTHAAALRSDGSVVLWGANGLGQLNLPTGPSEAVQIALRRGFSLLVRPDGTVLAVGENFGNQAVTLPGLDDVTAVFPRDTSVVAQKSDGTLIAWGINDPDTLEQLASLRDIKGLAVGWRIAAVVPSSLVRAEFIEQPTNQVAPVGGSASFQAVLTETAPAKYYQWSRNGTDIGDTSLTHGTNTPQLTFDQIQEGHAGTYRLTVTSDFETLTSDPAELVVGTPPNISIQPVATKTTIEGGSMSLTVWATGLGPLTYQWSVGGRTLVDGPNVSGATAQTLTVRNLTAADGGGENPYAVVVSNPFGSAISFTTILTVTSSTGGAPQITGQPLSVNAVSGQKVVLQTNVIGAGLQYQWHRVGVGLLEGETGPFLVLTNVSAADAGRYYCVITNSTGGVSTTDAILSVSGAADVAVPGFFSALSLRGNVGAGANQFFIGFNLVGPGGEVLVKAVGPGIAVEPFNVPDSMVDPELQLIAAGSGDTLATNDNWGGTAELIQANTQVGAFPLTDGTSRDAALLQNLPGGLYIAAARGVGDSTGVALAEFYGLDTPSNLNALALRGRIGTGADVFFIGFVIAGDSARTVLIKATGPGLAADNVPGAMSDPELELLQVINGTTVSLAANDNAAGAAALTDANQELGAYANLTNQDAALLITLPPGTYIARASGVSNTSGVALVEIYAQ